MSTLNYTYTTLPDGTTALGTQVMKNFNDVRAVINGLTQENIATGAVDSDEIATGAVTANKLDAAAVIESKMDYASANSGVKVVRCGPNYAGSGGMQMIRVESSQTLAAVTTEQTFTVDWSASDAADGAVTFSDTPTASGIAIVDGVAAVTGVMDYIKITAINTTGCTVKCRFSGGAPTGGAIILSMLVAGPVA